MGEGEQARDELIISLMPLVVTIAKYTRRTYGNVMDYDDLVADGMHGAIAAVDRWEPDKGTLTAFAYARIRGAMLDAQRARFGRYVDGVSRKADANTISLHEPVGRQDEAGALSLADLLPDDEDSIAKMIDQLALRAALDKLDDKNAEVLWLYYFDNMTLKDIGERYGVSESRASQKLTAAREKLYRVLTKDGVEDFY